MTTKTQTFYVYTNEIGEPLYRNVRLQRADGSKSFKGQRPDGQGGWIDGLEDVRRVPYCLNEIVAPDALARDCYWSEGEKDTDVARERGLLASTFYGEPSEEQAFAVRRRTGWNIILPDNDATGERKARKAAELLHSLGLRVKVVRLPGLPPKGDVSDWFDAGHTVAELQTLVEATLPWKPGDEHWEPLSYFGDWQVPAFPVDALPQWLRQFVAELAEETQTPFDFGAMISLAVIASTVAGKFQVEARRGWCEPLNIYALVVAPPASRKTAVFARCIQPLEEIEAGMVEAAREDVAEAASKYRIMEARRDKAERAAARADADVERIALEADAAEIARELAKMKIPALPKLIADDATPEVLTTLLSEQNGRLGVFSAEGDLFDIVAGRYTNGSPNFAVLLKGHCGDALRVDRRGRAEFIECPALTIGLTVQPDVIRGLMAKSGFRGRGLVGRFLYSIPASLLGTRKSRTKPVDEGADYSYRKRVKELAAMPQPESENGNPIVKTLRFSNGADELLAIFQDEIEDQLGPGGELAGIADWAGKLPGAVVRIAGILALADDVNANVVEDPQLQRAVIIGLYLLAHAKAVFAEMGADEEIESAKHLLRWIERTAVETFTKRDAHQANRSRFKKITNIEPALELLTEHNFIRPLQSAELGGGPGRKPSTLFGVHPEVHKPKAKPGRVKAAAASAEVEVFEV